jgi:hypothetical protein
VERKGFRLNDDETGFEDRTFQEVVEAFLYTSDGMFGDILFDAERELRKRLKPLFPPPEWAQKKGQDS